MGSRIRNWPDHVFECFIEVGLPRGDQRPDPFLLQKYPEDYRDEEILRSVSTFSYPCNFTTENVLHFSFVLTSIDSKWTFGFCRHSKAPSDTCLVLLSSLPWHDTFYKLLNHVASITNRKEGNFLTQFLEALYLSPVPQPGLQLNVVYYVNAKEYEFTAQCPDHHKIPSIPEDRNLTEYINAIDSNNMIVIFASMLNERRILMTSKRLSRLTACIQAANSLIYPMHWQHIFIPVLPTHLLDYLSAPMPFLIGVPAITMTRVKRQELGDVVLLDADDNRIDSPFDDVHMLPTEIITFLKRSLKSPNGLLGDSVARTFLKALVMLIGGYRDALTFPSGQKITFNKDAFITSRPPPMQPFLQKMLQLQIFQQFIEGRLQMLHDGEGFNDEFEFELNLYEDRSAHRLKTQYKEWLVAMRKEGSAILKSVNPAMKSAYKQVRDKGKQVRDKGKQAYKDLRLKMVKPPSIDSPMDQRPRSAPSSPSSSPSRDRRMLTSLKRKDGIKKSISGVIVTKTEKTTTYVKGISTKDHGSTNQMYNGFRTHSLLDPSAGPSVVAPAASSEDSDIEPNAENEGYKYDPINLDLMGDFQDLLLFRRCSLTAPDLQTLVDGNSTNSGETTSASSSLSSFAPPLAPPRSCQKKVTRSLDKVEENNLIQLESPPEDVSTIFDPLLEPEPKVVPRQERDSNARSHSDPPGPQTASSRLRLKPASNRPLTASPLSSSGPQNSNALSSTETRAIGSNISENPFLANDRNQKQNLRNHVNNGSSSQPEIKPHDKDKRQSALTSTSTFRTNSNSTSTPNPFHGNSSWYLTSNQEELASTLLSSPSPSSLNESKIRNNWQQFE